MASYLKYLRKFMSPFSKGRVAERQGTGLQNLLRRFESAHDLERTASRRRTLSYGKQSLDGPLFPQRAFFLVRPSSLSVFGTQTCPQI